MVRQTDRPTMTELLTWDIKQQNKQKNYESIRAESFLTGTGIWITFEPRHEIFNNLTF